MPKRLYPTDVLEQFQSVLEAWKQINPELSIGDLTTASLQSALEQANTIQTQMKALEAQITDLRNQRDEVYLGLWDSLKRVRNGIKAIYGDDSSQYEMVGGTRISERKAAVKKPVAA